MNEKKFSFKPQLSFDGVALLLAAIGLAVWVGGLKVTVEEHGKKIDRLETTAEQLGITTTRLTAIVEEQRDRQVYRSPKQSENKN